MATMSARLELPRHLAPFNRITERTAARGRVRTQTIANSSGGTETTWNGAEASLSCLGKAPASPSRRMLLTGAAAAAAAAGALPFSPRAAQATPLAPLGRLERGVGGAKLTGLSAEKVKDILARNLREGQYFVTGDLEPRIFADDCRFKDPTNDVTGLSRYLKALGLLFDASVSAVRLVDIQVADPQTIEAEWQLGGYLRFPWHPRVDAFTGRTLYRLNGEGLVQAQEQTWSISSGEALRESFTPTPGLRDDIKQQLLSSQV